MDASLPRISPDPLSESDSLHEATLLSMTYDALSSSFAILLDLRTAMYIDAHHTNTGVLVLRSVSALALSPNERAGRIWLVDEVVVTPKNSHLDLYLYDIVWDQSFTIGAHVAQFVTGFVGGLGDLAAELDEDETRAYFRTTPGWDSSIDLRGMTSRGI